jgi:hypothetical protein
MVVNISEDSEAFIFGVLGCNEDVAIAYFFDTLVMIYQTTRSNIPEDFTAVSTSKSHTEKKYVEH